MVEVTYISSLYIYCAYALVAICFDHVHSVKGLYIYLYMDKNMMKNNVLKQKSFDFNMSISLSIKMYAKGREQYMEVLHL